MWFSFFTNVLTFSVALILCLSWKARPINRYFFLFILLTGVTAGIAAFGHLPLLHKNWQSGLLMLSRALNLMAIFSFATGALVHFQYYDRTWLKVLNPALILIAMSWLAYSNVFTPVMLYGVIGMLFIGVLSFILNFKSDKRTHSIIISGVGLIALSAAIFAAFKHNTDFVASDISHIIIATSLIILTFGFHQLTPQKIED